MTKKITVLVDNDSWILPFAEELISVLHNLGYETLLARDHNDVKTGWINFMLGCTKITPINILKKNQYNLVVHESDLPSGKGFAPMAWQILEGKNEIPICLIEANEEVDAGNIWIKDFIKLDGTELYHEWRNKQGKKTVEICLKFVDGYRELKPTKQVGESSCYPRRTLNDSELPIKNTIEENFNLLRVVDNKKYPAFFYIGEQKYTLKIEKG